MTTTEPEKKGFQFPGTMTVLVLTWRAYGKSASGQSSAYSAVCQPSGELVPIRAVEAVGAGGRCLRAGGACR